MIIATDLDGTLISSDTSISNENLGAIKRLFEYGAHIVLVTGRTFYEILPQLTDCPYIDYFVYSNGACIYKQGSGLVFSNCMPAADAKKIYDILSSYETFIELYTNGKPLVDHAKFCDCGFERYKISKQFLPELKRSRIPVKNLDFAMLENAAYIEMFDVFFASMQERAECRKRIETEFPDFQITTSLDNNLEVMNSGVNKGTGIKKLCEKAGYKLDDIVAFGDSKNDITMFETVKNSYAVSNACNELKEISKGIACSNDENIMLWAENEFYGSK